MNLFRVFSLLCVAVVITLSTGSSSLFAAETAPKTVTLLTPGIRFDLANPALPWGDLTSPNSDGRVQYNGMIAALERDGYRFGGVVRSRGGTVRFPASIDMRGASAAPERATLFAMEFSNGANADGLAMKTLEFAACVRELKRYTGCDSINVVAYSAGGLVARAYLQNALPMLRYEGEVDRLITISTPHLGSTMAEHFGDFLGTRATAIQPGSETITRLNNALDLPLEVEFASIVVRGRRIGSRGLKSVHEDTFGAQVDRAKLARLPLDFRQGHDQVVNVWSQNLALTQSARVYEEKSGRPVYSVIARVSDPMPQDLRPFEKTVHEVAPRSVEVIRLTRMLLASDAPFWNEVSGDTRAAWLACQAEQCAYSAIENAQMQRHRFSEVTSTKVKHLQLISANEGRMQFVFEGEAESKWRFPPRWGNDKRYRGQLDLTVDSFGRIVACQQTAKVLD